jgi:hypothetical protein
MTHQNPSIIAKLTGMSSIKSNDAVHNDTINIAFDILREQARSFLKASLQILKQRR